MQEPIQVLVIFLVISFWFKLHDKELWTHLRSHSVCFHFLWHGNTNEKRQLMAWGGDCMVSAGRLQWQVWTPVKEAGWEDTEFAKKTTFSSFQKYLPVIIWCHVHSISVNWNKLSFVQEAAQDILAPRSSSKLHKEEDVWHSTCPLQDCSFGYHQPEAAEPQARLSPGSQFAKDRFVNTAARAMSVLGNEMGQGPFSSLEANWHSATFILLAKLSYLHKQSSRIQAFYWELSLACAISWALSEHFLGKHSLQQAKALLGLG